MRKIFFVSFLFLFYTNVFAYENLTIYDIDGDRILYEYNGSEKNLIASTTKVMTSIITLENSSLNNEFIINKEDTDTYGSSIYLKENDKIKVIDLLHGLLLRSGNDAALTLSNHIYGKETFVDLMNLKAYTLGMKDTTFSNAHGLDNENKNISTTNDMVKLIAYASKNKDYLKISGTRKYVFNNTEWFNKNELLNYYKYTTSGKTGYTDKAGYTFISTASKNGMNIAIASFKDKDRFNTHKRLYEEYFSKYKKYELLNKYSFNINSNNKDEYLYIKNNYSMLLTEEETKNVNIVINIYDKKVNGKSGYISIMLNDKEIHREYIYSIKYNDRKKNLFMLLNK